MTFTRDLKLGPISRLFGGVVAARVMLMLLVLSVVISSESAATQRVLASALSADTTTRKTKSKASTAFARQQIENDRVFAARYEKRFEIKQLFRERGIAFPAEQIFMRIFKRERVLEMWVRPAGQDTFALLQSYEICALSDQLGPKREQGDRQTPEGFYYIDDFNPRSGFHLSLHIDYPNRSDRVLGSDNLGGDIFIHGGCKTEGCLAVTDEGIKEIYWLAVEARDAGQQRIPVHIFPTRLTNNNLAQLVNVFSREPELIRFWSNLKPGYDHFAENKTLFEVTVNSRGRYRYPKNEGLLGVPTAGAAASDPAKGN